MAKTHKRKKDKELAASETYQLSMTSFQRMNSPRINPSILLVMCCLWICCAGTGISGVHGSLDCTCSNIARRRGRDTNKSLPRSTAPIIVPSRGGGANGGEDAPSPSLIEKHPFASAVAITTTNAVAADLLTQFVLDPSSSNGGKKWDPKRTALFAAFGFVFQGCVQYSMVNLVLERLFPGTSAKSVMSKIASMNFLCDPLFFFPTFYIFKESMQRGRLAIGSALSKYGENIFADVRNNLLVWLPGHSVTYGVCKVHQRIPWMAFLSFFYMCVLSLTRGGSSGGNEAVSAEL